MKCDICNKEMKYFTENQLCGWKCNSCGNEILTTYDDGINLDTSIYTIYILPDNSTTAINIKHVARIIGCTFLEAKEYLISGKEIKEINAVQARDILKAIKLTDIKYSITPDFIYNI